MDISSIKEKSIDKIINTTNSLSRYMTLDTFCKCVKNDSMLFSKPKIWRESYDPFEDILSNFVTDKSTLHVTENFYAQCWNSGDECDGMWRNYASLENGVMVQTTEADIVEWIIDFLVAQDYFKDKTVYENENLILAQLTGMIKSFRVDYVDTDEIVQKMEDILELDDNNNISPNLEALLTSDKYIDLLAIKRKHYEYEKEYRVTLSIMENSLIKIENDKLFVNGFKKLVKRIVFSPKFNECQFEFYKNNLVSKYGFNESIVEKSKIYDVKSYLKGSKLKLKI